MQRFVLHDHDASWSARYEPLLVELPQCLILTQCIQWLCVLFFSSQPTCSGVISTLHPSAKYGNKKKKKLMETKPMASRCRCNRKPLGHSYRGPAALFGQMCYHAFNATPPHTVTPPKQRNKKKKPVHPSCGVTYRALTPSCPNITDQNKAQNIGDQRSRITIDN